MAKLNSKLCLCFLSLLIFADFVISADPLKISPNLAPGNEEDASSFSPPPNKLSAAPASSPSFQISGPPAPPPFHSSSGSSPTHSPLPSPSDARNPNSPGPSPSDVSDNKSPAPSPSDASDINHVVSADTGIEEPKGSSGGMTGLQKFGITVGVIVAAGVVLVGGFVYKKRQDNIRRSRYAYAAGGDFI